MKNKEFRTLMAVITLTGTLLVGLTAGAAPVYAAPATPSKTASKDVKNTASAANSANTSSAKPYKDETVYATIDESGTVKAVTVSDQLKNISDTTQITDKSDLQNIENVKGDETFTSKDGKLVWDTADADICYQGTTDKSLPVGVKVSYTLDGKQINADELAGKSGHLVIRYTYENNTAAASGDATPFLMATGLMLDSAVFKNVTVTNGKLISDGEKEIAVGLGVPALSEMLGTDALDIPDYFEVSADVTEYAPVEGMTIATNSLFNDLETDGFESLSDLEASMDQLQSASTQLVNGSGELRKGLDTLLSSSGTLTDGISQLAAGSTTLANGTLTLKNGAGELSGGLNTSASKVSGELLPGIQALDSGVAQMQGSLEQGLPTLSNGVSALSGGISQVADGTKALNGGISQVADGTQALAGGIAQVGDGASALNTGIQALAQQTPALEQGAANVSAGAASLAGQLDQLAQTTGTTTYNDTTNNWDEISILQGLLDSGIITDGSAVASINDVIASLSSEQSERDTAAAAVASAPDISTILDQLAIGANTLSVGAQEVAAGTTAINAQFQPGAALIDGAARLDAALNTGDGTNPALRAAASQLDAALNTGSDTTPSLRNAASQLDSALNSGDSANHISSLRDGASQLNVAVNGENGLTTQVGNGMSQLKDGTSRLLAGVDGENGLAAGLNLLNAGAGQLASGSTDLNTGANTLASGINTLQTGSGALIDGVKQLDDGAVQLNDGMIQFDQDGIQKLVNAFGGDIEGLLDKANSMLDTSKAYKNFSGIADDMDGEVKFVFITE